MSTGLSQLSASVDALDLGSRGDDLAVAIRAADRLQAKIVEALVGFDGDALYELDAATSSTAWLRQQGMTAGAAAALVRLAKHLRKLPATLRAWVGDTLTGGQVQAIVANVDDATIDLLAGVEADLVPLLSPLDVDATAEVMRRWKARADALVDRPEPAQRRRTAHHSRLLDGRSRLDADLDVEGTELVRLGLRLAASADGEGTPRTPAERRGDALVDVFRFFLDHQNRTPTEHRHRPHVNVVIDINDLEAEAVAAGKLLAGGYLDHARIQALLCDCKVNRVVTDGRSVILDYGTSVRTAPPGLFRAVALRDQGCRHAGCDRGPEWCELHHVQPWEPRHPGEPRGPTSITNGVLKCSRHHHIGHQPGWAEKLEPDGTYHLTAPDGRTWITYAPGVTPPLVDVPV